MSYRETNMMKQLIIMTLISCLLFPATAFADGALATVKGYSNKVLEVLRDPALKPKSAQEVKKDRIRAVSVKMFDFTELSKRTLAVNWNKLDPEQQKEFVGLYRSLLEDAYATKILSFSDGEVVFVKEVRFSEKTAEVQSTIIRKTGEVPVYYRVILKDGAWRVYDVVIEGVSLVSNYRNQFREILSNKSPESLIETMRKKVAKR